eukprot:3563551-Rhodomonas_salina.1
MAGRLDQHRQNLHPDDLTGPFPRPQAAIPSRKSLGTNVTPSTPECAAARLPRIDVSSGRGSG